MTNNKTFITMTKVTLTPAELSDIIDQAFALGKIYAIDEINSTDMEVPSPRNVSADAFNTWIENRGGHSLNSGDAKLDILWEACAMSMKESLKDVIDY
jgi:hypothetical protein